MHRMLVSTVFICFSIILLVTIFLTYLNWNEKLAQPIFSVLFIATVTTFVTVFVSLKETKIEKKFSTILIINDNHKSPQFLMHSPTDEFNNFLTGYCFIAEGKDGVSDVPDSTDKRVFKSPQDDSELISFGEELIQYRIFKDIIELHYERQGVSSGIGGVKVFNSKPTLPSDVIKSPVADIKNEISKNRFSTSGPELFWIDTSLLKLPPKTEVLFSKVKSSPETGVEKCILTFSKKNFFTVEIIVETFGAIGPAGPNAVPNNILIPASQVSACRTFFFPITLRATFDKITAGNWRTEQYKSWVNWLFTELENKYSFK